MKYRVAWLILTAIVRSIIFWAGVLLVVSGAYLIYHPAGIIALGLVMVVEGSGVSVPSKRKRAE